LTQYIISNENSVQLFSIKIMSLKLAFRCGWEYKCSMKNILTRRGVLAGGVSLAVTAAFAGSAAFAQESTALTQEEATLTAIQNVNVPYRDARDNSRDAVQFMAASLSEGAQTIVLYQPTNEIWDATLDGARRQLLNRETALNGMLLAAGEQREIAFYTNSQLTATILNPDPTTLSQEIQDQLKNDYENYIRPLELALDNTDKQTLDADS